MLTVGETMERFRAAEVGDLAKAADAHTATGVRTASCHGPQSARH
ncbi:hypothetical protein [Streptomyces sp. NBC_01571]|nr:hypothetical protein [Streptomyces sp. NBC_01571]